MDHDTPNPADTRRESDAVLNARSRIELISETYGTNHPEFATALNQLALLFIMQGEPQQAEPLLRQALEVRRQTLGQNHPDYATNLSSLGGLLWARGDLTAAEPLLRQAAEVRCYTLGPAHPKSVVSLNSLDQLVKARRELVLRALDAEPPNLDPYGAMAASAATAATPRTFADGIPVPSQTSTSARGTPGDNVVRLGPTIRADQVVRPGTPFPTVFPTPAEPPRVAASTAPPAIPTRPVPPPPTPPTPIAAPVPKRVAPPPTPALTPKPATPTPAPRPVAPPSAPIDPMWRTPLPEPASSGTLADSVASRLATLRSAFAELAANLETSGQDLQKGIPPAVEIETQARHVTDLFVKLGDVVRAASRELDVAGPSDGVVSLDTITAFLPALYQAEVERSAAGQTRKAALAVLDRATRLSYPSDEGFAPLAARLADVKTLRQAIADASPAALPAEAQRLAEGAHPIAALVGLVSANETTPDAQWATWYDVVEAQFSHPLAVAAARRKLVLRAD